MGNRGLKPKKDPAYDAALQARLRVCWEAALKEPQGVAIQTLNPDALRRYLYISRRTLHEEGDLRFDHFSVFKAPAPGQEAADEIWIIPKERPDGQI